MNDFLPVTRADMEKRGWDEVDFVLVTGDAYVDHPSFGTAIISRLLERYGYKVAILPQPDWHSAKDFKRFGRPRLGFLINGGNVDSMVNNYSVFKHRRARDIYSAGGKNGRRPDRAVIVYCNRAREAYKDLPIMIGGLEASLRRLGHYDYWEDKVRRSILLDARADILMYGMGERAVLDIAESLNAGIAAKDITWIPGTCVRVDEIPAGDDIEILPSFETIAADKDAYAKSFAVQYANHDGLSASRLLEPYGKKDADGTPAYYVLQNIPALPLERDELDDLYDLPFMRTYHPMYEQEGGVPAIREVRFSITGTRGCFGGCAFCALTYHQGRQVRSRSKESILAEAQLITEMPDFKGYIHDVGGPTADFRQPACKQQLERGVCKHKDCMTPHPCKNLIVDHNEYIDVLRAVRAIPGVKKVFIRSGLRYDYIMADKDDTFLREVIQHHISGTLKVAPEHASDRVLAKMRKPGGHVFRDFTKKYFALNKELGKDQYLIPYFISSHPGARLEDAVLLAEYLHETGFVPDQVQDFYPTPGTLATAMYWCEKDPLTGEDVYVAKTMREKKMQRALLHFNKKENRQTVMEALHEAHREDLIPVLLGHGGQHKKAGGQKARGNGTGRGKSGKPAKSGQKPRYKKH